MFGSVLDMDTKSLFRPIPFFYFVFFLLVVFFIFPPIFKKEKSFIKLKVGAYLLYMYLDFIRPLLHVATERKFLTNRSTD